MNDKKRMALAMAEQLEKLANGLEKAGAVKEAEANRKKAQEIRRAQA